MFDWMKKILGVGTADDAERAEWIDKYNALSDAFLLTKATGDRFIGENIRQFVERQGHMPPHHPNMWGIASRHQIRRWVKRGDVAIVGVRKSASPRSHGCLCPLYERV